MASKRLKYFILTDDTNLLTTPSTAIRRVTRAKGVLYITNLDAGQQTTQRMRRTEGYVNIFLILRTMTVKRMTITRGILL